MKEDPDWSLSNCEPRRDRLSRDVGSWGTVLAVLVSIGFILYLAGMVWIVWFHGEQA